MFLGHKCGVKPFQLHGHGMHPCIGDNVCFTRGSEVELHPYSVDVRMIFPVVVNKIDEILKSKYSIIISDSLTRIIQSKSNYSNKLARYDFIKSRHD